MRLRYGQFLGEQTSEVEHDREAATQDSGQPSITETYGHSHDSTLEATFFSQSIRAQLKAALSEMWESEGRLRTHRPADSLPFQYRALEQLKQVQQRSRLYLKKVGFAPPPIPESEKRLTGELNEIRSSRRARTTDPNPTQDAVRRALSLLASIQSDGAGGSSESLDDLEQAGVQLARLALEQPGRYLESLNRLRQLIDSLDDADRLCRSCIPPVRRGLWALLPERGPQVAPGFGPASSLASEYFSRLERQP